MTGGKPRFWAGVDAGSRVIKAVIFDSAAGRVRAAGALDQGVDQAGLARGLLLSLLAETGLGRRDLGAVVATGYGRAAVVDADTTITEITCHARGVTHAHANAAAVIDIGGQDSKFVHLDGRGRVRDFSMNDRCAAGTGRFLEIVAGRLGTPLSALGAMAAAADRPAAISSMCAVFAETEIVGLLAAQERPENIVAGVLDAIASRVAAMAGRKPAGTVYFTGGVALVDGMAQALERALGQPVTVACDPRMTGAVGAALLAAEGARKSPAAGGGSGLAARHGG